MISNEERKVYGNFSSVLAADFSAGNKVFGKNFFVNAYIKSFYKKFLSLCGKFKTTILIKFDLIISGRRGWI
jgi:hypothetical protein